MNCALKSPQLLPSLPSLPGFGQSHSDRGALDDHLTTGEGGGHIIMTSSSAAHLIADVLVLVQSKSPGVLHRRAA